jgi:hypothetical protein
MHWSKRQQGWYISLTKKFWADSDLVDVVEQLNPVAEKLFLQR